MERTANPKVTVNNGYKNYKEDTAMERRTTPTTIIKKAVVKLMLAVMCVTTMANAGAFPTVFENPAYVVEAAENTDNSKVPQNVKAVSNTPTSIIVSCDKVDGISVYIFYAIEKGQTKRKSILSYGTSVVFRNLKENTEYEIYVKTQRQENGTFINSELSPVVCVTTTDTSASTEAPVVEEKNMVPENVTIKDVEPFDVTLSWDKVEDASKYYIEYGEPGKEPKTISTQKTSIIIKNLKAGRTYEFKIKSRYLNDDRKFEDSEYSKVVTHTTMELPASKLSASNTSDDATKTITLTFDTQPYMTRRYIYRSTDGVNFQEYKIVSRSKETFVDKNVEEGKTYYYKTRTYSNDTLHLCYGPYSEVVSVTIPKTVVEAPTTEAPTTEAPTTEALTTEAPTTEAPTTEAPAKTPEELQAERDAVNRQMAYDILDMVNAERTKLGYAPVTMNEDLLNVSAVRAEEIKTKYSHTRPNGTKWSTAYKEAGITFTGTKGENLMWGVRTAKDFYTAWYNSPGHYRNMTNPSFTQIGISIYQDPATGYRYAAMELARVVDK